MDLNVDGGCFPRLSFAAKKGIIIEGSVTPGIQKVVITATGESQLGLIVHSGLTNSEGKYRIGPVEEIMFRLSASLDDYSFVLKGTSDFSALKVPMIAVGCKCGGFVKIVGRMGLTRSGVV